MRAAVVGHVEWVWFACVERLPARGEIVRAHADFEEPAGGGAVAAVQLARLGAEVDLFTALGDDPRGRAAAARLRDEHGVNVHAVWRPPPQRRAFTFLDGGAERTITVLGERHVPGGADPLPWERLAEASCAYFTAGDADALSAARRAGALVATPRARGPLATGGVRLDALVHSARDPGERFEPGALQPPPGLVVSTLGDRGGRYTTDTGEAGAWRAGELPGEPVDAYGCGDALAAGLAFALGRGDPPARAVRLAVRCGAACLTGRGPYTAMLTRDRLAAVEEA